MRENQKSDADDEAWERLFAELTGGTVEVNRFVYTEYIYFRS